MLSDWKKGTKKNNDNYYDYSYFAATAAAFTQVDIDERHTN